MAKAKKPFSVDWSTRCNLRGPGEHTVGELLVSLRDRLAPDALGVAISYVDDRIMRKLNREHRNQHKTTDVLSFPSDTEKGAFPHLGDIVISLPVAEKLARKLETSRKRVVETLLIHGFLHLCGHDHEQDQGEMMALQARLEEEILGTKSLSLTKKRGRKPGSKLKQLKDGSKVVVTGRAAKAIVQKEQAQKQKAKTVRKSSATPPPKTPGRSRPAQGAPKRGPGRPRKAIPEGDEPRTRKAPRRRKPARPRTGVLA